MIKEQGLGLENEDQDHGQSTKTRITAVVPETGIQDQDFRTRISGAGTGRKDVRTGTTTSRPGP